MAENESQGAPLIDPKIVQPVAATIISRPTVEKPVETSNIPRRLRQPTADQLGPGQYCWGTGRRKASVARVRIRPGSGKILINKKELNDYFCLVKDRSEVTSPMDATKTLDRYDVFVNAKGGGTTGQAGAIKMGLARALMSAEPDTESTLRDGGFMTRDARMVERKKYGLKKARKSFQFSKR